VEELINLLEKLPFEPGKPNAVLARTVKGKGISFMEDQISWHHRVPTDSEYAAALMELEKAAKTLEKTDERL
jgi:transketolase